MMEMASRKRTGDSPGTPPGPDPPTDPRVQEKLQKVENYLKEHLGPHEFYIMSLQRLLIWEVPWQSAILFVAVNFVFWMAMSLSLYSLLGLLGIAVVGIDVWVTKVWPEIKVQPSPNSDIEGWTHVEPGLVSVPEICQGLAHVIVYISSFLNWLAVLRHDREGRAKFFLVMTTLFIGLAVIGYYISDITIAYVTVMTLLLCPAILHHNLIQKSYEYLEPVLMRVEYTMKIKRRRPKKVKEPPPDTSKDHVETESDSDLDEFVPSPDPVATAALARAITDSEDETPNTSPDTSQVVRRQAEVMPSLSSDLLSSMDSFGLGVDAMPSMDEIDRSHSILSATKRDPHYHGDSQATLADAESIDFDAAPLTGGNTTLDERALRSGLSFHAAQDDSSSSDLDISGGPIRGQRSPSHVSHDSSERNNEMERRKVKDTEPEVDLRQGLSAALNQAVATATATHVMETTVAGLNKLGQSMKAAAAKLEAAAADRIRSAEKRKESHSREAPEKEMSEAQILEEFEFLNKEDLEGYPESKPQKS